MGKGGLEPPRLAALVPKTSVAAITPLPRIYDAVGMHYTVHLLSNKSVLLFFVMQYQGYTSMHSIFKERFTMADQHESQVSEVGKNQNEQTARTNWNSKMKISSMPSPR